MNNQNTSPIFIHSLFRAGSTYIFNTFRRADTNYWCYQEPLNEFLINAATEPDRLLEVAKEKQKYLRHPKLKKPYFYEFHAIADKVADFFKKELSYDQFFAKTDCETIDLRKYFNALLDGAHGRAVYQCCRTTGRVKPLKSEFGGVHIFLWRNPWDQWWSYKKDAYFDKSNLLISNANNLPSFIQRIKDELQIPDFHHSDIGAEYGFFDGHRLDSSGSYKLFYAIWCHSMLEARPCSDLSVCIDELSESATYREHKIQELEKFGVFGLDFSDCSISMASYGKADGEFFLETETYIHGLLLENGYDQTDVEPLIKLSLQRKESLIDSGVSENSILVDAMRAREMLCDMESKVADVHAELHETKVVLQQTRYEFQESEEKELKLKNELLKVYSSHSWRITMPLRWVVGVTKILIKKVLSRFIAYLWLRPRFKQYLLDAASIYPLIMKIIQIYPLSENELVSRCHKPVVAGDLNPQGQAIYQKLKDSVGTENT